MTFMYWWLNMHHRIQALSSKKWYVRDNPKSTGYTVDDLAKMSVQSLSKQMVGYTSNIPGTRASKGKLRRLMLGMVRQIEIETSAVGTGGGARGGGPALGDVPCIFGTLTSQRYQWDEVIRLIAEVEGIPDRRTLGKGKRRALVNKYPLLVSWYCAVRLELTLKAVVVPYLGASAYMGVFEWSPTGGMLHLHYVAWVPGAPRFDLRAEFLQQRAKDLRRAGVAGGGEAPCRIDDVVGFFGAYISEWNPNKSPSGEDLHDRVAETVNEAEPHTASLSVEEMLAICRPENSEARWEFYKRAVRTEQQHDFHYPEPLGPPNPAQPCARLLKGTVNMWYCSAGYPRDLVCEPCDQSVAQDPLKQDLWRTNLCRNCQVTNAHIPVASLGAQSNTDAQPVATRGASENYCCKYCTKSTRPMGARSALAEAVDDMGRKDEAAREKFGQAMHESKLGAKIHRAFMAEVGQEMCQGEVAHHANKLPEYFCSRPEKYVALYKKALAVDTAGAGRRAKAARLAEGGVGGDGRLDGEAWWGDGEEDAWWLDAAAADGAVGGDDGDGAGGGGAPPAAAPKRRARSATKPSDLELYERRTQYWFAYGEALSPDLPPAATPEEQVEAASVFDFFRLVQMHGGSEPYLSWHARGEQPIVLISPVVRLEEGADFAFHARWALMQYHAWSDRRRFLDLSDDGAKRYFWDWLETEGCPPFVKDDYRRANDKRLLGVGRGKRGKDPSAAGGGAAGGAANGPASAEEGSGEEGEPGLASESEASSEGGAASEREDTRVLKMLYAGSMAEVNKREEQCRKAKVVSRRHNVYRNTRCTNLAQEEQSALPAGVVNIYEDSDDNDAYGGEQKEIQRELDELRVAQHWINQEGWNAAAEGRAASAAAGAEVDLRLDWGEVRRKLAPGAGAGEEPQGEAVDAASVEGDHGLDALDPVQRAFADRLLGWAAEVASRYKRVRDTG